MELPDMPERDLSSAVGWQVSRDLAESDGSKLYDYYDLGAVIRGGKPRRGLLAVTSNTTAIDQTGQIALGQGLDLTSVGDETGFLARLQPSTRSGGEAPGISAVFNVGAEKTTLMLVGNGRVMDASQLMRGTRWLEDQALRLTRRQDTERHADAEPDPHESSTAQLRICGLLTREWEQALRVAAHHCAERAGEPLTVDEVAVYAPQAYAGPLLRAWQAQSDIRAVDLDEAISLRFANEMHCPQVPGPVPDKCRLALLQASEQISQSRTNKR